MGLVRKASTTTPRTCARIELSPSHGRDEDLPRDRGEEVSLGYKLVGYLRRVWKSIFCIFWNVDYKLLNYYENTFNCLNLKCA